MSDEFNRKWQQIQEAGPDLGVRSLFSFAHDAVVAGTHPDEIAEAYRIAIELQDRDPESPTYGNFRWYRKNERPQDLNAVEFCTAVGVLTWRDHRDELNDTAKHRLEDLLRMCAEGIRGHKVLITYTNIFIKKSWNTIALGEVMGMSDLAEEGYRMFADWCAYTAANGFHEYLSPTYYSVDLDSLEKIASYAGREEERALAEKAIRHLWTDIGANWYDQADRLGGAHSRDYDYLTGNSQRIKGRMSAMLAGEASEGHVCDEALRETVRELRDTLPRTVCQSWGDQPGQTACQYQTNEFSIGSACASRHNMDKVLTISFGSGPETPVMNLIMDGRGDPYGVSPVTEKDGHTKSRHLVPFVASVQREAEVLAVFSAGPETWAPLIAPRPKDPPNPLQTTGLSFDASGMPTELYSHLVIPLNSTVAIGDTIVARPSHPAVFDIPLETPVLVEVDDTEVAVRTLYASRPDGGDASLQLVVDESGLEHDVMRLTWTHADSEPDGRGTLAVHIAASSGHVSDLMSHVSGSADLDVDGGHIDVSVDGLHGRMRIEADCDRGERIALEGGQPEQQEAVLCVNGRDHAKEIWSKNG